MSQCRAGLRSRPVPVAGDGTPVMKRYPKQESNMRIVFVVSHLDEGSSLLDFVPVAAYNSFTDLVLNYPGYPDDVLPLTEVAFKAWDNSDAEHQHLNNVKVTPVPYY